MCLYEIVVLLEGWQSDASAEASLIVAYDMSVGTTQD